MRDPVFWAALLVGTLGVALFWQMHVNAQGRERTEELQASNDEMAHALFCASEEIDQLRGHNLELEAQLSQARESERQRRAFWAEVSARPELN